MPGIRQLPTSVVNKIAAGEVIERPASAVKELMENSVDAEAQQIQVWLEKGGTQLLRVADDGGGIAADQLPLAVASHATSKIVEAEDLFSVRSLGFRGEALASLAEVSRLAIRSRIDGSADGGELRVEGGRQQPVVPCACAVGTQVEVADLFFNTPVRRKFLRTISTELAHATEAFQRIALAHPRRSFHLVHNQREVYRLGPAEDWRERVATLFGPELAEGLLWVESQDDQVRISGYVAEPSHSRSHPRMQYLFLNGRYIRDRSLQHALGEAYRGLLLSGRYPVCFLCLEMPPELVDVNVHPTKLEVRFQDSGRLYSHLLSVLRTRFLTTDLTARVGFHPPSDADTKDPGGYEVAMPADVEAPRAGPTPGGPGRFTPGPPFRATGPLFAQPGGHQATSYDDSASFGNPGPGGPTPAGIGPGQAPDEPFGSGHTGPGRQSALQAHDRYLVTESDEGLMVIDQHALHERILYEELRRKVLGHSLDKQRLLVPEPVQLAPAEASAVLQHQALLSELGIEVEDFGGGTVIISAYPAMLANIQPGELLRQVAAQLTSPGGALSHRDLLDELLHTVACRAAIKAGDRLTQPEIDALLERRHLVDDSHHCPHGRPTTLIFTRDELDRRFKRT